VQAVLAESRCAASALVYPLAGLDVARTPVLHWRWKIVHPLQVEDERRRRGDDFAARVYVMFDFEPARASFWDRMQRALATKLYGAELPGNALNYVWTAGQPRGARWDNPFTDAVKMISLGRGQLRDWREERVDVAADYGSSFGTPPPAATALAVMTDADNSCQQATAAFADFGFASR